MGDKDVVRGAFEPTETEFEEMLKRKVPNQARPVLQG